MRSFYFLISSVVVSIFLFLSCNESTTMDPPLVDETFNGFQSKEVAEIFAQNCTESQCHGEEGPNHQLKLTKYSEMIKGSEGRPVDGHGHEKISGQPFHESVYGGSPVVPFNAEKSLMYNLLTGNIVDQTQRMPYQRGSLSQANIDIIKDWINNGAKNFEGEVPYLNSRKVFVCNQGSDEIFEIDTDYEVVSRIISVDHNSTIIDAPHNIQLRNGFYYVTLVAAGKLLKINSTTHQLAGEVSGIEYAGMVQITNDGSMAFVSRSSTAPGNYNIIYAVNTETMQKQEILLPAPGLPHAIWLTNDDSTLYVGNMTLDRISIIDVNTLSFVDDIILPAGKVYEPMHLYVSPDDNYLYVNCRTSSSMLVIKLETNEVLQEVPIQLHPMHSAVSNDGNTIYTVSHHEPIITEITKSGETWSVTNEYTNEAFHHLYGADLSPDGRYLYVTCSNNDPVEPFEPHYKIPNKPMPALVCVYDTQLKEVIKIMDVGSFATGIAAREN